MLPRSHNHTPSVDMGEASRRKQKSNNNKSVSELMNMLPAQPDRATHCFVAWLSTVEPDQIDWDEDTFQVIIDGVCKINSSLVDILTFLVEEVKRCMQLCTQLAISMAYRWAPLISLILSVTNYTPMASSCIHLLMRMCMNNTWNYSMFAEKIKNIMRRSIEARKKM